jgi:hypothetical protein
MKGYDAEFRRAAEKAGIHPSQIYAAEKTGYILTELNRHLMPTAGVEAFEAAVDEWYELHGEDDEPAEGDVARREDRHEEEALVNEKQKPPRSANVDMSRGDGTAVIHIKVEQGDHLSDYELEHLMEVVVDFLGHSKIGFDEITSSGAPNPTGRVDPSFEFQVVAEGDEGWVDYSKK